ncbi:MAG: protein kinase domain-containing protein [Steroidobacteraceae bacterium]
MTEVWTRWEGQVVNGIYPLRRFLNASDHSSVFLTESTTEGFLNAAIKLVPADPELTAVQLWHWKTAATFSHPHLIRLLDAGQCEIEGRPLLFVVMEYAEESLSQILPYRALEAGEVRELLVPTLDALAFLHRENWVQGQLKPSNFLVVNDQLKLASDTIRPVGVAIERGARRSVYDSPETERGKVSAAADVWALGVTLIEALTQYPPAGLESGAPSLPPNLPSELADTLQRCLSPDPADRPTIADLQARTRPTPAVQDGNLASSAQPATPGRPESAGRAESTARAQASAGAEPTTRAQASTRAEPTTRVEALPRAEPTVRVETPRAAASARAAPLGSEPQPESARRATAHAYSPSFEPAKRSFATPTNAAALLVVLLAAWGATRLFHGHSKSQRSADGTSFQQSAAPASSDQPPPAPAAAPPSEPSTMQQPAPRSSASSAQRSASQPAVPHHAPESAAQRRHSAANTSSAVVHEEIPEVPQSARETIRGRVKVAVRVTVDRSGNVVRDKFENAGPSRYFSRLASEAARKWKFTSADNEGSREWLLRFEFGRDGTTVHAVRARS